MIATDLIERLRASKGIEHKRDIQRAFAGLRDLHASELCAVGDDCAAIPDGNGYLLFAIEGLLEAFVAAEPWFAGYCAVMVNISDVAAMGGRPTAVVDALWCSEAAHGAEIWAGMQAASRAYGVPIVGGHTNLRSGRDYLAAAILGRADRLLTSFDAAPGDVLIAAIDLRGAFYKSYDYWNASTDAPPPRLRADLDVLAGIANDGLARAGKDISMGGIIGTITMLAECSRTGAAIDLAAIPRPPDVPLERWLLTFPSYGYVLAARPENAEAVLARFRARDIASAAIGSITAERHVTLATASGTDEFWNLEREAFIGARAHG